MPRLLIALLSLTFLTGCSEKTEPKPQPENLVFHSETTDEDLAEKLNGLTELKSLGLDD